MLTMNIARREAALRNLRPYVEPASAEFTPTKRRKRRVTPNTQQRHFIDSHHSYSDDQEAEAHSIHPRAARKFITSTTPSEKLEPVRYKKPTVYSPASQNSSSDEEEKEKRQGDASNNTSDSVIDPSYAHEEIKKQKKKKTHCRQSLKLRALERDNESLYGN